MAEVAGLTLGAVGITALFSTCIECLDIVVSVKDFSYEFEIQCAKASVIVARFKIGF
jgi:hypothetical protein